ncbi:tail assembly chaperone [Pantoea rodasii]|uniref:Tail assembly chaperone n=1 Tax=Pantoea rodasii TaxID=1076549 RepID=A0A2M9WHH6_9GAMM|nr:tail fiber assembly protein [Pantoea rodasii]ORM62216.1 hypothetical protein HA45_18050 [Pantoea rodasii]PJZ07022.1 tail assembly chaperone [Pantoea rodasii]
MDNAFKTFNNFTRYVPEKELFPEVKGVIYLRDEKDRDWYTLLKEFSSDTLKIAYDAEGIIRSASLDASMLFPAGLSVSEVEEKDGDEAGEKLCLGQWVYRGGSIKPLDKPDKTWAEEAEGRRLELISGANSTIILWQTRLLAGRSLTDEQKQKLNTWLDYMDKLESLNFSDIKDKAGYQAIVWPVRP